MGKTIQKGSYLMYIIIFSTDILIKNYYKYKHIFIFTYYINRKMIKKTKMKDNNCSKLLISAV
jgi:hypothetical protein